MSTLLSSFSPRHIPPVVVATLLSLGGLLPFWNPAYAMREFGLPERVASSPTAHTPFTVQGARTAMYGLAMWTFYLRHDFRSLDTMMSLLLLAGVFDGYLCWREGEPRNGLSRFFAGAVLGGWGILGMTKG